MLLILLLFEIYEKNLTKIIHICGMCHLEAVNSVKFPPAKYLPTLFKLNNDTDSESNV